MHLFNLLRDNMATYITAGSSYTLFVQWLVKTRTIFESAGFAEEWPAYFQKITKSPAVSRKPNLVRAIQAERKLHETSPNSSTSSTPSIPSTSSTYSSLYSNSSTTSRSTTSSHSTSTSSQQDPDCPPGYSRHPCVGCRKLLQVITTSETCNIQTSSKRSSIEMLTFDLQFRKTMSIVTCPECKTSHRNIQVHGRSMLQKL